MYSESSFKNIQNKIEIFHNAKNYLNQNRDRCEAPFQRKLFKDRCHKKHKNNYSYIQKRWNSKTRVV